MMISTGAGPIELDETDIPLHLRKRARTWFTQQVKQLERSHGDHWPANKDWLADYLRAELRKLVEKEAVHAV